MSAFVEWSRATITGDEKGEAQIFLDRLFQALGHKGCLEVGGTPEFRVRKGRDAGGGVAFADYVWKPFVLIEMKRRGEDLNRHYRQAFDYWVRLVPGRPRYVILCNFDELWVFDFETQMDTPVDRLPLAELPTRDGPLAFLFPSHDRPIFENDHEQVTRDAADKLATCFNKLIHRKVPRDLAQRFTLQMLVALFAEDIGLLERYFVSRLLAECRSPTDSFDLLGGLFEAMNSPRPISGGRYRGVDYFNGGLFEIPARVELHDDELNQLRRASEADWSKVRPEIFGTLLEHSLEAGERHAFGGHFTHPTDIMKIVGPTIVEPWRGLIENASSPAELERLRQRMQTYRVLDPACGSGNFLYIAYRELKRLEARLLERISERKTKTADREQRQFGFVTANQFFGMDINPFAVEIAKVTMMIARKLAIDELHATERPLPLDNLDDNFTAGDALVTPFKNGGVPLPTMLFAEMEEDPWKVGRIAPAEWPRADVIIGNPPFLGAKRLKPERGVDYVNAVRKAYPDVPGMADYCVYWFRAAHDRLPACTREDPVAGRAGLAGTQNIRNNKSREGGLDHVVKTGTIIEAVENQPWSGEANVHVSIVNWVKTKDRRLLPKTRRLWQRADPPPERKRIRKRGDGPTTKEFELTERECAEINSALSDMVDVSNAPTLRCNQKPQLCFQGVVPGYDGFVVSLELHETFTRREQSIEKFVRPYQIGRDLLGGDGTPRRWVIDFGHMSILEALRAPVLLKHLEINVLPAVRKKAEEAKEPDMAVARLEHLDRWWQFWNVRQGLRKAIRGKRRFIVCSRVTKRPVFAFISKVILPDNSLQVFAFEDDYSFGVLQSAVHWQWFVAKCSKLKSDFRYTPKSVFDTFPWPQKPKAKQIRAVAKAGRDVRAIRADALTKIKGGLRAVYRGMELPGKNPLKQAHGDLDAAVMEAYGFDAGGDLLGKLLKLNFAVVERIERVEAVTAPGIPEDYPNPNELVTEDCIQP
ncbi:MAG: class I SAM-dependent DNA methyltransferase [Phycisphaerales bacterium]|nr:class I SAM-dependent DNA methyltransferase [Phycisphaerales bacterium]